MSPTCQSWYNHEDFNFFDDADKKAIRIKFGLKRPMVSEGNSRIQFRFGQEYRYKIGFNVFESRQSITRPHYGASETMSLLLFETADSADRLIVLSATSLALLLS